MAASLTKGNLTKTIIWLSSVLLIFANCQGKVDEIEQDQNMSNRSSIYRDFDTDILDEDNLPADMYYDGIYCAEVEYYNPNTGTRSTYTLHVEVEHDELVTIYWPNGGWLDESHFIREDISDGNCLIFSDKGYEYFVSIIGGNCITDLYLNDFDSDEEEDYWNKEEIDDEEFELFDEDF